MIYLHPGYSHSPEHVRAVEVTTGLIAIIRGGKPILVSPSPAASGTTPPACPRESGEREHSPRCGGCFFDPPLRGW